MKYIKLAATFQCYYSVKANLGQVEGWIFPFYASNFNLKNPSSSLIRWQAACTEYFQEEKTCLIRSIWYQKSKAIYLSYLDLRTETANNLTSFLFFCLGSLLVLQWLQVGGMSVNSSSVIHLKFVTSKILHNNCSRSVVIIMMQDQKWPKAKKQKNCLLFCSCFYNYQATSSA